MNEETVEVQWDDDAIAGTLRLFGLAMDDQNYMGAYEALEPTAVLFSRPRLKARSTREYQARCIEMTELYDAFKDAIQVCDTGARDVASAQARASLIGIVEYEAQRARIDLSARAREERAKKRAKKKEDDNVIQKGETNE